MNSMKDEYVAQLSQYVPRYFDCACPNLDTRINLDTPGYMRYVMD